MQWNLYFDYLLIKAICVFRTFRVPEEFRIHQGTGIQALRDTSCLCDSIRWSIIVKNNLYVYMYLAVLHCIKINILFIEFTAIFSISYYGILIIKKGKRRIING